MKSLLVTAALLLSLFNLTAQDMTPQQTVIDLFVSTDQHNWSQLETLFAPQVTLDYSSMTSQPATTQTPQQITTAWKGVLPGFEHTHHQVGNFKVQETGQTATAFCYGTATHYLADDAGAVWTVVGTYDFELDRSSTGQWQITAMTFHFKYQDGNTALPLKAMERAKS